jgi:hypothetical protein
MMIWLSSEDKLSPCALISVRMCLLFGFTYGGFIKGILRGVRCTKSLRVLFLHRRPPSWTTLVLYSRAVFIFNEPAYKLLFPYRSKDNEEVIECRHCF